MEKILIIDDDAISRVGLGEMVATAGFSVLEAAGGREGLAVLEKEPVSAVLLDLIMPGMDGIATLEKLRETRPDMPVIMVTAYGDVPLAVKATKLGAYDFILKPPDAEHLVLILKRAVEKMALRQEVERLHTFVDSAVEKLLGKSKVLKEIQKDIQRVAETDFSIIIQGETGTGKTTLARGIHALSKRSQHPFVKVDIGTLSESLIESELFGHEKGAFTGADKKKKGFFEAAQGGTIFIDEIENMSLAMQAKVLNAIEEKEICPVGSHAPVKVDFRLIGATNTDIQKLVKEKRMRQDLYYRLGEYTITLPPLRERPDDIRYFAGKFMEDARDELNRPVEEISEAAMRRLARCPWPGNIRELKNFIKKLVLFADGRAITEMQVESLIQEGGESGAVPMALPLRDQLKLHEKNIIVRALKEANGNKSLAASLLQTSYKNLFNKLNEFGLMKE